jgi:hypothetical protein
MHIMCSSAAGGATYFVQKWRRANALQLVHAPTTSHEKRHELRALWELTDFHMQKANYHARKFRHQGLAGLVLAPAVYVAFVKLHKRQHITLHISEASFSS